MEPATGAVASSPDQRGFLQSLIPVLRTWPPVLAPLWSRQSTDPDVFEGTRILARPSLTQQGKRWSGDDNDAPLQVEVWSIPTLSGHPPTHMVGHRGFTPPLGQQMSGQPDREHTGASPVCLIQTRPAFPPDTPDPAHLQSEISTHSSETVPVPRGGSETPPGALSRPSSLPYRRVAS